MSRDPHPIIGVSRDIQKINELIKHVANTNLNVVISGETGVGKEVVAQNLYQNSNRIGKPFIKINCAALPDGLLESELYGYEQGAFTGADRKKRGKFEIAHGGVLFLDEIGDMPLLLQSKLLHVLQTGEFSPLGSEKEYFTDTWIIAATNRDLNQEVLNKKFREDLYYRLNIININVSPLRERPEDIPHLIDYYMEIYISKFNKKGFANPNNQIIKKLMAYHWPGNVREMQNILKKALVLGSWENVIEELSKKIKNSNNFETIVEPAYKSAVSNFSSSQFLQENALNDPLFSLKNVRQKALDGIEKEIITYVLNKTEWNRSKASKILKVSYKTLLSKISDLNLTPPAN